MIPNRSVAAPRPWRRFFLLLNLFFAISAGVATPWTTQAGAPRVLPEGQLPKDRRLEPLKDLDGYFPFTPSPTPAQWAERAQALRHQLLVALGLWPMPTRTPLNAVIHGKIDRPEYTVEKVCFESVPGFFVTGNLYRPKNKTGPLPGILCPHGHWDHGRFIEYSTDKIKHEIVQGAERFQEGGRSVLQSRCVQLARMGCVVFHYDMIGYADSTQIPMEIAHEFARQRPEMNSTDNWGLFSPQAESHLQSVMSLQTWNSIRALDFLLSLPGIDSERIGVTGASGGGTQTFLLCALDPRPTVAFPAVMVSTAMQGGCTCENASLLRIDTGNVEIAALFAPKPLGMTAANDWTREMPTKGFPELKQHYALLGAPDNVMLKPLVHFEHNYNYVSRAAMYSWFNKQFKLGLPEPVVEEDYQRLTTPELSVWDNDHPQPPGGPDFERKLLHWLTVDVENSLASVADSMPTYRKVVGAAADVLIGRNLAEVGDVSWTLYDKQSQSGYTLSTGLLRASRYGEEIPAVLLQPNQATGRTVIWTTDSGKSGLFLNSSTTPTLRPGVRKLLDSGATVLGLDLLYQGEFLADGRPLTQTPKVANPRESGAYTFGYNRPVFAHRVHDVLTAIQFLRNRHSKADLALVALDSTGPVVALARAQAGEAVDRAAIDTQGFRFGEVKELRDVNFLPGGAKYGDLPGFLALSAPGRLWLAGEPSGVPALVKNLYRRANAEDQVTAAPSAVDEREPAALAWLTSK